MTHSNSSADFGQISLDTTPGKTTYSRFAPEGPEDLEKPSLHGSWNEEGGAYLFLFPFDIYTDPDLEERQTSYVDATQIHLFPPFRHTQTVGRAIQQIELERVPTPDDAVAPDYDRVRLKDLRMHRDLGEPCNALRVDLLSDPGPEFAKRIVDQFLGLVRWWTGQWWVGRDRQHSESYLRNWFPINEKHERVRGVQAFASGYGFLGMEKPLNLEYFRNIRGNITNERTAPLHVNLFHDGVYYQSTGDVRRSVLELATSCEAGVAIAFENLAREKGISPTKTKKLLSEGFEKRIASKSKKVVGVSFKEQEPDSWETLYDLWVARGNVAHGKGPIVRGGSVWDEDDLIDTIEAVSRLLAWLELIDPEHPRTARA